MAKVKDSAIEACLHRIVRLANNQGETVTLKLARSRAEAELGLERGFFKAPEWKSRSNDIIEAAYNEEDEDVDEANKADESEPTRKQDESKSRKSDKNSKKDRSASIENSQAATPTPKRPESTAPKVNGVKRKAQEPEPAAVQGNKQNTSQGKEASAEPAKKKAKIDSPKPSPKTSEDSSTESEEESSSEDESEEAEKEVVQTLPSPAKPTAPTTKDTTQAIPSRAFKPPSGYTAVDSSLLKANASYSAVNLKGSKYGTSQLPLQCLCPLSRN